MFIFPAPFIAILVLLGLLFLCSKRWPRPRLGKILIASGMILYLLLHSSAFTEKLLEPIEYKYPAHLPEAVLATSTLDHASGQANGLVNLGSIGNSSVGHSSPPPEFIIVFGQSVSLSTELPVPSRTNSVYLERLIEAVRLHRIYPDARVVVSMGNGRLTYEDKRKWLDKFAVIVGVDPGAMDLVTGAQNTDDEVKLFKEIVGDKRVIAVSSASHISRIMKILERNNINAVPAPCGHAIRHDRPGGLFPNAESMLHAQTAFYERLGQIWEGMIRNKAD